MTALDRAATTVTELLGAEADDLLSHTCTTIGNQSMLLPGPSIWTRP